MAVVLAVIASGCGASPTGIAASVSGQWELTEGVVGSSFRMNLTSVGSSITGTGTWVAEAGPGGTSVITGSVSGGKVDLDIAQTANMTTGPVLWSQDHFTGHLVLDALQGTMTAGRPGIPTDTSSATFTRP